MRRQGLGRRDRGHRVTLGQDDVGLDRAAARDLGDGRRQAAAGDGWFSGSSSRI